MMPAMRAIESTSPLATVPLLMRSNVLRPMTMRPLAVAVRAVESLAETSTIRARPLASKWVRRAISGLLNGRRRGSGLDERARGGFHVRLTHQRFADQECPRAHCRHAREIVGRLEPAFGDDKAFLRHLCRQHLGDGEIRRQRLEVAIVNADERRL